MFSITEISINDLHVLYKNKYNVYISKIEEEMYLMKIFNFCYCIFAFKDESKKTMKRIEKGSKRVKEFILIYSKMHDK